MTSDVEIDDSMTELHPVPLYSWSVLAIESSISMCGGSPGDLSEKSTIP